jgi:hypothetical protein
MHPPELLRMIADDRRTRLVASATAHHITRSDSRRATPQCATHTVDRARTSTRRFLNGIHR